MRQHQTVYNTLGYALKQHHFSNRETNDSSMSTSHAYSHLNNQPYGNRKPMKQPENDFRQLTLSTTNLRRSQVQPEGFIPDFKQKRAHMNKFSVRSQCSKELRVLIDVIRADNANAKIRKQRSFSIVKFGYSDALLRAMGFVNFVLVFERFPNKVEDKWLFGLKRTEDEYYPYHENYLERRLDVLVAKCIDNNEPPEIFRKIKSRQKDATDEIDFCVNKLGLKWTTDAFSGPGEYLADVSQKLVDKYIDAHPGRSKELADSETSSIGQMFENEMIDMTIDSDMSVTSCGDTIDHNYEIMPSYIDSPLQPNEMQLSCNTVNEYHDCYIENAIADHYFDVRSGLDTVSNPICHQVADQVSEHLLDDLKLISFQNPLKVFMMARMYDPQYKCQTDNDKIERLRAKAYLITKTIQTRRFNALLNGGQPHDRDVQSRLSQHHMRLAEKISASLN